MSEEKIFLAALDQPDAAARARYLGEACQGNAELREQVEKLLAWHFKSGEFLDVPAPEQVQIETCAGDAVTIVSMGLPAQHEAAAMNQDDDKVGLEFLAPSSRPDSLGRIGHYEVLQVLGKGGFGTVLRAFDDVLQRVVAIKVMAPELAATSPARKRFRREAESSAKVRHENVVQVYEVGEQPLPYLVMEFIPGETLQQRLDRLGPLDVPETVRIGRQIAEGLAAAHAMDLIHRDIKPGNVLLEGGHLKVKITDFGLARAGDDASMTQSGMIAGTPMYMAPEQVLGHLLDQRADLFSLGTVMYQMAAGRAPFRAPNSVAVLKRVAEDTPRSIREVIPETPQWLCDIISKLHAKNPDERYQSAREVADVLADCEEQLKQNSRLRDYSRIPRSGPQSSSGKWKWAAAAALLLPIVALTATELAGVTRLFRGLMPVAVVTPPVTPAGDAKIVPAADKRVEPKEEPATPGFTKLFNGQDLTGWKKHALSGGDWKVEDGAIDGRGSTSYLFTESGDYANFHLRIEAKINGNGDAGVYIRTPFDVRPLPISGPAKFTLLAGYEAAIALRASYPTHTGSLTAADGSTLNAGPLLPHKPDEWFVLEVIAEDNHIRTLVDGKPAADYTDDKRRASRGHIALQTWGPGITSVQFRRVEIKELPASSEAPPSTYTNSLGMEFVLVPKGKSWLGGGKDQPGEQEVEIPADFYLGKYEVTQEEWVKVMGGNPSAFSHTGEGKDAVKDVSDADLKRFPVVSVTWDQCQIFVAKLNKLEKETGWAYRLPTKAEWEYACRGGPMSDKVDSAFDFYFAKPTNTLLPEQANFNKGLNRTCKVGSYEPNRLGLFDLHGNVWEWCENTEKAVVSVSPRVYLGGSYTDFLEDTRTALRRTKIGERVVQLAQMTSHRFRNLGLRLARVPSDAPLPEVKTPPLAVAPFDATQAKNYQDSWAKHLSVPVEYINSIGMKFRLIPPGEFLMGASEAEIERILDGVTLNWQITRMKAEGPQQPMTVREPYYLGQHEVTLGQFRQFVQETGYKTTAETNGKGGERNLVEPERKIEVRPDYIWSNPIDSPTDDYPVVFVSLEDARQFCLWLSNKDGRTYALPRDDQWEFACRAGTTTRWSDEKDVPRIAWVRENSEGRLHAIGLKAANPFGLCDMHGNAAELCEPVPPKNAARRGGDSTSSVVSCRSASRWELGDSLPWYRNGFRVAIVGDLNGSALAPATLADAEVKRIAALPAEQQVEEVRKELIQRNPGFDGKLEHKIEGGVVTELKILTDEVVNIAPVKALAGLKYLDCRGTYLDKGKLSDLSPLKGMTLSQLDCSSTQVADLTALVGMPLTILHFNHNPVSDLTPLAGMPLRELGLAQTKVSDLSPLKGMRLQKLGAQILPVTDLTPLAGMPLKNLDLYGTTGVTNLEPLKGMPLEFLNLQNVPVSDLSALQGMTSLRHLHLAGNRLSDLAPLQGLKLRDLILLDKRVSDLSPLQGMPLVRLVIYGSGVSDLRPLQGMSLVEIRLTPQNITQGLDILREMKSLHTIGIGPATAQAWPAAEFWKRLDKGEFK